MGPSILNRQKYPMMWHLGEALDAKPQPKSMFSKLLAWEREGLPGEKRLQAMRTVDDAHCRGTPTVALNLLFIRELPPLPPITGLEANYNRLTTLNDLPESLSTVCARGNQLRKMPDQWPSALKYLDLSENKLEELSEFPLFMREIIVCDNKLTALPHYLPRFLDVLDVRKNVLTDVPDDLFRLPKTATVQLRGNPLSAACIKKIKERMREENYAGPKIQYDDPDLAAGANAAATAATTAPYTGYLPYLEKRVRFISHPDVYADKDCRDVYAKNVKNN